MAYAPPLRKVKLRSRDRLERAMRARDVNGSELAALTDTPRQSLSRLRRGERDSINERTAAAIEKALRVAHGDLFEYEATA